VRIALACPYAWDDPGGVQVHVRELASYLREAGHETLVLAPARRPVPDLGVVAVGRPIDVPYNRSNAPIDPRPWSVRAVRRILDRFRPDVVHAHQPTVPSTGMWATLASRVPVVGSFHSGADRSLLYDLAAPVLRRVTNRLAVRIAVSERAAEFERARIDGAFQLVPNGLDVQAFAGAEPADLGLGRKLLFVGRLHARKGFLVAVAAFRMLASDRPDLRLIVVGEGEQRDAVGLLPEILRDRVTMVGTVEHAALPRLHAASDVYIGSAVGGESFGYVLIEAMAAGLPVVASDIPGYDEVVRDGVDGLLVPPSDPDALAAAVARVLDDRSLAAALAARGAERARAFDWSVVGARLEGLYDQALGSAPSSLR
jgi:phosphatidylinositol alpha-mannosyltransferase